MRLQQRGNAKPPRSLHDLRSADLFRHTHSHGVQRACDRLAQRHLASVLASEILRRPAVHRDRPVEDTGIRCHTGFQRRQVHHRLEGRARLAQRTGHTVELAGGIAAPADHRQHGAVIPQRHQGHFRALRVGASHGVFGKALQARVERRLDRQITARIARVARCPIQHPVGKITPRLPRDPGDRPGRVAPPGTPRIGDRFGFLRPQISGIDHRRQHSTRTPVRGLGVGIGIEPRGRTQEPRQHRRLVTVDLAHGHAEIALGRGFHSIGTRAKIDPVEINCEQLVFLEPVFQRQRQKKLPDLACVGTLRR